MTTFSSFSAETTARIQDLAENDAGRSEYRAVLGNALDRLSQATNETAADITNAVRTAAKAYALQLLEDARSEPSLNGTVSEAAQDFERARSLVMGVNSDEDRFALLRDQTLQKIDQASAALDSISNGGDLRASRDALLDVKPAFGRGQVVGGPKVPGSAVTGR